MEDHLLLVILLVLEIHMVARIAKMQVRTVLIISLTVQTRTRTVS